MKSIRIRSLAQSGFTLIELIIVIVIVGILAVVAIPKFTNISAQAAQASTEGIAGNLASAAATNYALRSGIATLGTAVANCTDAALLLQGGVLPAGYSITAAAAAQTNPATSTTCTLTGTNGTTATFIVIGVA